MLRSLIFSKGILNIPDLNHFLPECEILRPSFFGRCNVVQNQVKQVIGWGLRPSTVKARAFAEKNRLPYIALEDGFLRSLGLGVKGYPPFSMVYDDVGIYYDTTRPSRLENLLLNEPLIDEDKIQLAEKALSQIIEAQLSKYNHALDFTETPSSDQKRVLVIDQTFGDMAVKFGQASEQDFNRMLEVAIQENPNAQIWVKTHPDVLSGKKKGYLTDLPQYADKVRIITQDVNPASLIKWCDKVYCVTSQMGFEALLLGKNVVTFGVPWFAGWGVTDDRNSSVNTLKQGRRAKRTLLQLFYAAYFDYSRYINPNTGESGSIFDVIDYLRKAKMLNQHLSGNLYCVGMSLWKQAVIKPFFKVPQCRLHFVRSLNSLKKRPLADNAKLLVWSNGKPEIQQFAKQNNIPLLRMEDGFIRSVGLGANLVAPLSLVVDDLGIYFNAENTSRLEQILLNEADNFSEQDLSDAENLRQRLVNAHIGKYNVGGGDVCFNAQGKKTILVPGQVEDDASIKSGSPIFKKNLDLLKKVRELNPEAYIIYKPHPDVVSGNRIGHIPNDESVKFADQIVDNANILDCILQVDEVHTMTSLAGFEALLRNKKVHCYGLPFYAGWGLTDDFLQTERRHKKLTLTQLIAATLIYYPLYVDPERGQFIDAHQAINILEKQKENLTNHGIKRSWLSKQAGKLKQLYRAFRQSY